jgi:outer membrane lipopolysaccharide assembly protein LptE/RlpB
VVADPAMAKALIKLYGVEYERRVRSIDSRGKVNGYTLIYTVRFSVTRQDGAELRKDEPIQLERDFNFDSDQVLQAEGEERALREDMEKDMAQRIMRQLSTIAAAPGRRQWAALSQRAAG